MTDNDALVSDYLGRLETAASGLPADRRAELIEEISAHIAEARAQSSASIAGPDSDLLDLLGRLGDPEEIVSAASDSPVLVPGQASLQRSGEGTTVTVMPPAADPLMARRTAGLPPPTAESGGLAARGVAAGGGASTPGTSTSGTSTSGTSTSGPGALEVAAVILSIGSAVLLPVLPALAVVGWLVGVVLLWYSPRWRTSDKILGTLVWPVGIGLAVLLRELALLGVSAASPAGLGALYTLVRLTEAGAAIVAVIIVTVRLLRRAARPAA